MQTPKGKLISIGGNEDKGTAKNKRYRQKKHLNFFELDILKRIIAEINHENSCIEVITSASSIPKELGNAYLNAFGKLGCSKIGLMHIRNAEEASSPEVIARISKADGVMFTGGNQNKLIKILEGTPCHTILHERYMKENFLIAGTSAGAMAMSKKMIKGGSASESLIKGAVNLGTGFGFIHNVIIDSHFITRGRFGRLAEATAINPEHIGIGLGEDTGVLITNGNTLEAIGSGLVIIFDGYQIKHNSTPGIPAGTPLSIENMVVHALAKGNRYLIRERKFLASLSESAPLPKEFHVRG